MSKQIILETAVKLASKLGYRGVYKRHLSEALEIGMGTVNYHWGTMAALRVAIIQEAIRVGNKQIVMQAIANRDPVIHQKNLSRPLREKLISLDLSAAL